jgi:hypothetical protein
MHIVTGLHNIPSLVDLASSSPARRQRKPRRQPTGKRHPAPPPADTRPLRERLAVPK